VCGQVYYLFIFLFYFFYFCQRTGFYFWGRFKINTLAPQAKSKKQKQKMPLPATQPIAIPRRRKPSAKPTDATAAESKEVHVPDPWIPGPRCIASSRPEPSPPAELKLADVGALRSPWQESGVAPPLYEAWLKGP
jgi:hypothetical protein